MSRPLGLRRNLFAPEEPPRGGVQQQNEIDYREHEAIPACASFNDAQCNGNGNKRDLDDPEPANSPEKKETDDGRKCHQRDPQKEWGIRNEDRDDDGVCDPDDHIRPQGPRRFPPLSHTASLFRGRRSPTVGRARPDEGDDGREL